MSIQSIFVALCLRNYVTLVYSYGVFNGIVRRLRSVNVGTVTLKQMCEGSVNF